MMAAVMSVGLDPQAKMIVVSVVKKHVEWKTRWIAART
jgi:hypothetical protein